MNLKQILCCVAMALIAYASLAEAPRAQVAEFSVKLTDPARDGIEVKTGMTVKGTAAIPAGYHVWVLARRADFEGVWWPQGEGKIDPPTREWKVAVTFGGVQDIGWDFDVSVIVVKEDDHIVLQNYRKEAMKSGNWKPIEAPSSATPPQIRKVKKVGHS